MIHGNPKKRRLSNRPLSLYIRDALRKAHPSAPGDKGPVTNEDFEIFVQDMKASGTKEKTVRDCASVLLSIMRYAGEQGWWPIPTVKNPMPSRQQKKEFTPLTVEEQRAIIKYIPRRILRREILAFIWLLRPESPAASYVPLPGRILTSKPKSSTYEVFSTANTSSTQKNSSALGWQRQRNMSRPVQFL